MSGCRSRQDLTFQYPCSFRFPPLREGNRRGGTGFPRFARGTEKRARSVPPASRGNLKEGVLVHSRFYELWLRDGYQTLGRGSSRSPVFANYGCAIGTRIQQRPLCRVGRQRVYPCRLVASARSSVPLLALLAYPRVAVLQGFVVCPHAKARELGKRTHRRLRLGAVIGRATQQLHHLALCIRR